MTELANLHPAVLERVVDDIASRMTLASILAEPNADEIIEVLSANPNYSEITRRMFWLYVGRLEN